MTPEVHSQLYQARRLALQAASMINAAISDTTRQIESSELSQMNDLLTEALNHTSTAMRLIQ